jgi:uncharacterized phage protein (TIGR01671 family)
MRDIKFRAWWGIKNRFLEGVDKVEFWNNRPYSVNTLLNIKQDEIVLMQYTGLKDKNGKEIYEGDVIETDEGIIALCKWQNLGFVFVSDTNNIFDIVESEIKVIGNIYENSELLKELN